MDTPDALTTKTTLLLLEPGAPWPSFLDRCPSDSHALVVFPRRPDETHCEWIERVQARARRFARAGARVATTVIATPSESAPAVRHHAELLSALAALPATRGCRVMLATPSGSSTTAVLEDASTLGPGLVRNDPTPPPRSGPRAAQPPAEQTASDWTGSPRAGAVAPAA